MSYKKIILADDHTLFRNGLKFLINSKENFKVEAEVSNGEELLEVLQRETFDIVLLDISMPKIDGFEAAARIKVLYPQLAIITLSMFGEDEYYFKMVNLGVKGFLLKNSNFDEVYNALITVSSGGTYFSQELLQNLVNNFQVSTTPLEVESDDALSEREKEVLILICKGMSNKEIGNVLFISKRTVDKHRANILDKTNCKNTANLVVYAITNNIVEL